MIFMCDVCSASGEADEFYTYYTVNHLADLPPILREERLGQVGLARDAIGEYIYSSLFFDRLSPIFTADLSWAICPACHEAVSAGLAAVLHRNEEANRFVTNLNGADIMGDEIAKGLFYFWFWRTDNVEPPGT